MKKYIPLVLALSLNSYAGEQSCLEKYEAYADAQAKWQEDSTALINQNLPKHAELANYYRDVQLATIERNRLAVKILEQHNPKLLASDEPMNHWLDLSPALDKKLAHYDPTYKTKLDALNTLKKKAPAGNSEDFRKAFRETLMSSDEFQRLLKNFNAEVLEINGQACKKK